MMTLFALLLVAVYVQSSAATLSCLSCKNVRNESECTTTITCGQNEKCFTSTSGHLGDRYYTLGCKAEHECNALTAAAGLIGRKRRATGYNNCHQCCAQDNCNALLCSKIDQVTVSAGEICEDSPAINCSELSRYTSICADVDHAKTLCKKWCGFCPIGDGNWSDWSAWSSCSVTCDTGHMTRTRTCTNPTPSHGGHSCIGKSSDSLNCHHRTKCPINGGWDSWLSWEPCSVTCGSGIKRRHRNCDNPVPVNNGHGCYGDVHDYASCSTNACNVNGGWGSWSPWGSCSVTCGVGLKRRERNCDNPVPANNGRDCRGDTHDYAICSFTMCDSSLNQPNVTFYVRDVQNHALSEGFKIQYKTILWDTAASYNNGTGVFTAPVTGIYVFTVTANIIARNYLALQIKTTSWQGQLGALIHYNDVFATTSSMTGVGKLQAGSQVWVQCIYLSGSGNTLEDAANNGEQNSFQGTLV